MTYQVSSNKWKQGRVVGTKLSFVKHLLQLETILMTDHWEWSSDVCYLKMAVLSCSIYHMFLKILVYEEGHHAKLGSFRFVKKPPLTSSEALGSNDL